jgi:hypothetical protein
MRLREITQPLVVSDDQLLVDLLKMSNGQILEKAIEIYRETRKISSVNGEPYIKTPGQIYGKDLGYLIMTANIFRKALLNDGLNEQSHVVKLLSETIRYLENKP